MVSNPLTSSGIARYHRPSEFRCVSRSRGGRVEARCCAVTGIEPVTDRERQAIVELADSALVLGANPEAHPHEKGLADWLET
jgi:hypothetical protein